MCTRFGVLLAWLLLQPSSLVAQIVLENWSTLAVWSEPRHSAAADLDLDGNLDLVFYQRSPSMITTLLGNGDGTFGPQTTTASPGGSVHLNLGDFNEDGFPDLHIRYYSSQFGRVYLGTGTGAFMIGPTLLCPGPTWSTAADFDLDGHLDIAMLDTTNDALRIYLGSGSGTFEALDPAPLSHQAFLGCLGDFDADGVPDLMLTSFQEVTGGSIFNERYMFYRGLGDGTFEPGPATPPTLALEGSTAADVNSDGHLDLLALNNSTPSYFEVHLGLGDGTFSLSDTYEMGNLVLEIELTDFDGDGVLDLVAPNSGVPHSVNLFRGGGDGTFTALPVLTDPASPVSVTTGDFDNDSDPDLLVNSFESLQVLYRNESLPHFLRGDCNGDSFLDLADPIRLLMWFKGSPVPCLDSCDANDDGELDLDDVLAMLNSQYGAETVPVSFPRGTCGTDWATSDTLGCSSSPCGGR